MKSLRSLGVVMLVCMTSTVSAQGPTWRDQDSIGWACGGIGYDERQALRAFESRGNLALLFVAGARGGLVADVRLRVVSANDASRGLEIVAEGPQCVLRLPSGDWRIEARYGNTVRERSLSVREATPGPLQRVQLSFPEEPGEAPRASPEEASQVGDWGKVGR